RNDSSSQLTKPFCRIGRKATIVSRNTRTGGTRLISADTAGPTPVVSNSSVTRFLTFDLFLPEFISYLIATSVRRQVLLTTWDRSFLSLAIHYFQACSGKPIARPKK